MSLTSEKNCSLWKAVRVIKHRARMNQINGFKRTQGRICYGGAYEDSLKLLQFYSVRITLVACPQAFFFLSFIFDSSTALTIDKSPACSKISLEKIRGSLYCRSVFVNPFWSFFCVLFFKCNPAGCLFELLMQLSVIMVGKQIFNNTIEIILP